MIDLLQIDTMNKVAMAAQTDAAQKGISLGEMQEKLLAKVEELTLHMIQENEQNADLASRVTEIQNANSRLDQENRQLKARIEHLEAGTRDAREYRSGN